MKRAWLKVVAAVVLTLTILRFTALALVGRTPRLPRPEPGEGQRADQTRFRLQLEAEDRRLEVQESIAATDERLRAIRARRRAIAAQLSKLSSALVLPLVFVLSLLSSPTHALAGELPDGRLAGWGNEMCFGLVDALVMQGSYARARPMVLELELLREDRELASDEIRILEEQIEIYRVALDDERERSRQLDALADRLTAEVAAHESAARAETRARRLRRAAVVIGSAALGLIAYEVVR